MKKQHRSLRLLGNTLCIAIGLVFVTSYSSNPEINNTDQILYEDANGIKEVKIGSQVWMTENLNLGFFRNGDPVPEARSEKEWELAAANKQPAWCYYDNDAENGKKYGRLYNWYAVNDPRGLTPAGWHIPTHSEWRQLTDCLGGWKVAGTKLKSKQGWSSGGNGTDDAGFSGMPGGRRTRYDSDTFVFIGIGNWGYWWTSTGFTQKTSRTRSLCYKLEIVQRLDWDKADGMSVRCVRDE